jgi:hypothetical protein
VAFRSVGFAVEMGRRCEPDGPSCNTSSLCDDGYSPQQAAAADMIPTAYPDTDLEDLEDWITGRIEGGLEGREWNAAQAMFERGEPPEKVANTILKQRRRGYAA